MKRFFTTLKNIFSIEDLRVRILNTIGFLVIFRLGSYIVLAGVNAAKLTGNQGGIFDLLNTFLGGSFSRASIFALGIMTYISASIVVHLLTVAVPHFTKLQKEGESGRKKLNQFTRDPTTLITSRESYGYLPSTINTQSSYN